MVAVGTIIWLASELMFFAALFAAYFTIRNVTNAQAAATGDRDVWQTQVTLINIPFAIVNTSVSGGELVHLPDGCVRGRARPGQTDRVAVCNPRAGACASGTR